MDQHESNSAPSDAVSDASVNAQPGHLPLRIALRRPPLWSLGLTVLSAIAVALFLSTLSDIGPRLWRSRTLTPADIMGLGSCALWFAIWLLVLLKRFVVRRFAFGPIVIDEHAMTLPRGPEGILRYTLAYADITSVIEGGGRQGRHFFIESTKRVYHLPQQTFAENTGAELLLRELRARLNALPEGPKRLVETERRRRAALAAMNARPWATQLFLGIIAVFFINTWLKGALETPFGLLRWGANAQALVAHGDWYRLFASNFLHGFWLHAGTNALALWFLGNLLERLMGWPRFVLLYLGSGALAMAASALLGRAIMSVGASGAIFGLLGSFAVLSYQLRDILPLGVRQSTRWWVTMVGVNTAVPMIWPTVDLTAHIAGFVVGALMTLMLLGRKRALPGSAGPVLIALAIVLMGVFGVALGDAVRHAADTSAHGEMQIAELLLSDLRSDPQTLSGLARRWVINPDSTPDHLEAAERAAHEAVRREPMVAEYRVIEAAAQQRRGLLAAAAHSQLLALEAAHQQADEPTEVHSDHDSALYAQLLVRTLETLRASGQNKEQLMGKTHGTLERRSNSWMLGGPRLADEEPLEPWYALVRDIKGRPVGFVRYTPPGHETGPYTLPEPLVRALSDVGASKADPVWQGFDWPSGKMPNEETWTLWRLPPPEPD